VEKTLRVTELDGKAFIQQSARMAWDERFEVFVPPAVLRKQAAEARRQRDLAAKLAGTHVSAPTAESAPAPADTIASTSTPPSPRPRLLPEHYIMNLPDSALTFLGAFNGLYDSLAGDEAFEAKLAEVGLPLVHVYCFTRELELETATTDICQVSLAYCPHGRVRRLTHSEQASTWVTLSRPPQTLTTCTSSAAWRRTRTCTA